MADQLRHLSQRTISGKKSTSKKQKKEDYNENDNENDNEDDVVYKIYKKDKKKKKENKLPIEYSKNLDLLDTIEEFLDDNELFNINEYKNEKELWENGGLLLSRFDFKNIQGIVHLYTHIANDIADIDNGVLDKYDVAGPGQKISELINRYEIIL